MNPEEFLNSLFRLWCSAGKRVWDKRCTSWRCLTSSLTSLCSCWLNSHAGADYYIKSSFTNKTECERRRFSWILVTVFDISSADCSRVFNLVSGWWWTTGPVSCLSWWAGRSLWFRPTFSDWFMVRPWSGQELFFAPCCRSSTPLNLLSSFTAKRWSCSFDKSQHFTQMFPGLFSSLTFLHRSHYSTTAGQLWRRFGPPPPLSFSWWCSCSAGCWPWLSWFIVLQSECWKHCVTLL